MKNIEEFIERLVTIGKLEDSELYGHYPFQMYVETKDNENILHALALGGMVEAVYKMFRRCYSEGAKRIYISLDFPAKLDIETDFIAIFCFEYREMNLFAIPYNNSTGEIYDRIQLENSELLKHIASDLNRFIPYD